MFCLQENERDPFNDSDPLDTDCQTDSDEPDEPAAKRLKINSLNLQVYQIPAFNTPKSLSIFPSSPVLPKFVNNPLNLANPLALASEANNIVKNLQTRFSLPAKLSITPVQAKNPFLTETGEVIRYKKNGEVAKKRGPPKGYKRKPKLDRAQSFSLGTTLQTQNTILTSLLAANNMTVLGLPPPPPPPKPKEVPLYIPPPIKVPVGVELVELHLDPSDWFPSEPYKMTFSRKKNPKWKLFPFRCEYCFKGYRVASTLLTHAAERHGTVPKQLAIPCPCCPHVSTCKKHHNKHLLTHSGKRHRIFCPYCLPPLNQSEPYIKESDKFPFDKCPQYWYASEESLRLHKKRKHPYSAMFNLNWYCSWRDAQPNS